MLTADRFLLIHFHIQYICQQTSPKNILKELEKLKIPTTDEGHLDKIYDRAIESIQKQGKPAIVLAKRIFSWLLKAKRTLTVDELQMGVAIELDRYELEDTDLPDRTTILDVCAGLVTIDENSNTIRLAHYTVHQYLKRSIIPDNTPADFHPAVVCTTFLSFNIFTQGACTSSASLTTRYATYPLLGYASYYLLAHLRSCDEALSLKPFLRFLSSPNCISSYSQAKTIEERIHIPNTGGTGVIEPKILPLRKVEEDPPLHIASAAGYSTAVQFLLENGANISAINSAQETALHSAASDGHEAVVQLLLGRDADVSVADRVGETALHRAASRGHDGVVRMLLEKGSIDSATYDLEQTTLHQAASHGHEVTVQVLLKNGVNASAVDFMGKTALHMAANCGHEGVVRQLLKVGINVSATTPLGETALHMAASHGHERVIRLLFEGGATDSGIPESGETALHRATYHGHEGAVQLFLNKKTSFSVTNCKSELRKINWWRYQNLCSTIKMEEGPQFDAVAAWVFTQGYSNWVCAFFALVGAETAPG